MHKSLCSVFRDRLRTGRMYESVVCVYGPAGPYTHTTGSKLRYQDGTESGWNSEFHPDSAWKQSSETCMKFTSAECTVETS